LNGCAWIRPSTYARSIVSRETIADFCRETPHFHADPFSRYTASLFHTFHAFVNRARMKMQSYLHFKLGFVAPKGFPLRGSCR
jgi:hypothetical protein